MTGLEVNRWLLQDNNFSFSDMYKHVSAVAGLQVDITELRNAADEIVSLDGEGSAAFYRQQTDVWTSRIRGKQRLVYNRRTILDQTQMFDIDDLFLPGELSREDSAGYLAELRRAAPREALSSSNKTTDKSPWADFIGTLYTTDGAAAALAISQDLVDELADSGGLFWIQTDENERLFPTSQFTGAHIVPGVQWMTGQLLETGIDRYTLGAWFNARLDSLDGLTPWQEMRRKPLSKRLRQIVSEMRDQMIQPPLD